MLGTETMVSLTVTKRKITDMTTIKFEDLPTLKGKGWQRVLHDGKVLLDEKGRVPLPVGVQNSNAKPFLRGLQRAVYNHNKSVEDESQRIGLDVEVTTTEIKFRVREKQYRPGQR